MEKSVEVTIRGRRFETCNPEYVDAPTLTCWSGSRGMNAPILGRKLESAERCKRDDAVSSPKAIDSPPSH